METKVNDEFMRGILIEEAWKELSGDFEWTETLLEKYQDKVGWDEISSNDSIRWTIPMLKKFARRINWTKLSKNANGNTLIPEIIETFKDKWDWYELSSNHYVPFTDELLKKYADLWNWEEIISSYCNPLFDEKGIDFYERFKEYIPASKLQSSSLWREMVKQQQKLLIKDIIS